MWALGHNGCHLSSRWNHAATGHAAVLSEKLSAVGAVGDVILADFSPVRRGLEKESKFGRTVARLHKMTATWLR